jgi:hypothetical protein
MITGPCGTWAAFWQRPTLLMLSVNVLLTFARMSVTIQRTIKHGLGTSPIMKGHPTIKN